MVSYGSIISCKCCQLNRHSGLDTAITYSLNVSIFQLRYLTSYIIDMLRGSMDFMGDGTTSPCLMGLSTDLNNIIRGDFTGLVLFGSFFIVLDSCDGKFIWKCNNMA